MSKERMPLTELLDILTEPQEICPAAIAITVGAMEMAVECLEASDVYMSGIAITLLNGQIQRTRKLWSTIYPDQDFPPEVTFKLLHELLSSADPAYQCNRWKEREARREKDAGIYPINTTLN